jgi:hypothetical protein
MTTKTPDIQANAWRVRPSGRVAATCVVLIWIGLAAGITAGYGAGAAVVLSPVVIITVLGAWRLALGAWRLALGAWLSSRTSPSVAQELSSKTQLAGVLSLTQTLQR